MMRSTPMKRTGFKRPDLPAVDNWRRQSSMNRGGPMKKRRRKPKMGDDRHKREACRGQRCFLRVPAVCNGRRDTVVPCHSNESALGKALGLKTPDKYTVPGCSACHFWLDQGPSPRLLKYGVWRRGYSEWSIERDGEEDINVPAL